MSEIRSQATPARDELAEAIKGYGKSFLGECEEVDVAKIEHSFDCMADGLADYLTEDDGWSKPRTVNSAAEAEALAEGSVILDARGEVLHWIDRGDYLQWSDIWGNECGADYPATVLFTPGEAG